MEDAEEAGSTWPTVASRLRVPLFIVGLGIFLSIVGIRIFFYSQKKDEIVFIENTSEASSSAQITVHVAGAVAHPGLYPLSTQARIQDAITAAGGITEEADKERVDRELNLAQKLSDGAKIYIPLINDTPAVVTSNVAGVSISKSKININSASNKELEELPGVGEVTANKIIAARPYTNLEDLTSKKIVSASVFEKIKDQISLY